MSRFGSIMTTQALVKSHLIEARIRVERKDWAAAVPHLLAAVDAQRTAINCLADLLKHPRERKGLMRKAALLLTVGAALTLNACAGGHRYHPCLGRGLDTCPEWVKAGRRTH